MSCFSVAPVEILGQQKWAVLMDGVQVAGPFDTPEAADAVCREMESALVEIRLAASKLAETVIEKLSADGNYLGKPLFFNRHYALIDTGRSTAILLSRAPLDAANIKLNVGSLIDFSYRNGHSKLNEKKVERDSGPTR